ncbi:MAG: hypothetical protein F6K22_22820 [Okeania sp. SIO2F4]|uniref:hypothetical protein n=1 Tax=Okeania sp. SIO2F4 TaxID=2607790 RepID=UPI00142C9177|nr:hypothetical protein [Okeania sp. SIO2F4]NES05400.1 hypothetical protein [Okeania sp. SIO2F4]
MKQLSLFPEWEDETAKSSINNYDERQRIETKFSHLIQEELKLGKLVSYISNKSLPILGLYRYKEAFAFSFVEEFIKRFQLTNKDLIFEPFCGMGTTPFTAMHANIKAVAIDKLPIAAFIANTMPLFWLVEPSSLHHNFELLQNKLRQFSPADVASDVAIMKKAFSPETLTELCQWKTAIETLSSPIKDIFLLLFLSILEPCSYTAKDGQFLRIKKDKKIYSPTEILQQKIYQAEQDIFSMRTLWGNKKRQLPQIQLADARDLKNVQFSQKPTAIITSPPYPNRYDYTRIYSLELCFNFVKNFEELKELRFSVLRSHIESKVQDNDTPNHPVIAEIVDILRQQGKVLNNPRIPDMLVGYFVDMSLVIKEWSRVLTSGAKVAMVVDNVRFAGELVPVDLILSEMAEKVGFKVEKIIVARYKGNSSQQMGKYGRIPVRESIVIWQKN